MSYSCSHKGIPIQVIFSIALKLIVLKVWPDVWSWFRGQLNQNIILSYCCSYKGIPTQSTSNSFYCFRIDSLKGMAWCLKLVWRPEKFLTDSNHFWFNISTFAKQNLDASYKLFGMHIIVQWLLLGSAHLHSE